MLLFPYKEVKKSVEQKIKRRRTHYDMSAKASEASSNLKSKAWMKRN